MTFRIVVLSQLGLKIQHALRAFTAKDRKSIQKAAENFPESDYYKVDQLLTELGIGEALVTALNEKGIPTPLVHCLSTSATIADGCAGTRRDQSLLAKVTTGQ